MAACALLTALLLPARIPAERWRKIMPTEARCLIGEHLHTSVPFMMWLGKICSHTGIQVEEKIFTDLLITIALRRLKLPVQSCSY